MADDSFDYDVVISGYGLAGQAAASLLARLGHHVAVYERFPALYGMPRLATIDGESARIIQAAADIDFSFRVSGWCRKYDLEDAEGALITSMDWSDLHTCGFPGRISFYQPDVEISMDEYARARGADIHQGWEAIGVDQDEDGVTVDLRPSSMVPSDEGLKEHTVRTRYLIAADGAKSAVRESAGIEREDFGFRDGWVCFDCERVGDIPKKLDRGVAITICDPGRTTAFIPIGNNRFRFEFQVQPDDDHSALLVPEVGYELLEASWGVTADQVRIYRQVIFPFEGKLATPWRQGRVLLAGDAAHLMPPFLAQGGCSALRDSINLAWKLDLVLRGISETSLLDTYELERSPHVRVLIEGSIALGRVACERDPEIAKERDEAYRSGNVPPPPDEPKLLDGVLHRSESGDLAKVTSDLIEQGMVRYRGETGRFDDLVGWGFHLIGLRFDPFEYLDKDQVGFLEAINCHVVQVTNDPGVSGAVLDLDRTYEAISKDNDGVRVLLSRPDFTVFGAGWSPDETAGLVDDLRSQLKLRTPSRALAR